MPLSPYGKPTTDSRGRPISYGGKLLQPGQEYLGGMPIDAEEYAAYMRTQGVIPEEVWGHGTPSGGDTVGQGLFGATAAATQASPLFAATGGTCTYLGQTFTIIGEGVAAGGACVPAAQGCSLSFDMDNKTVWCQTAGGSAPACPDGRLQCPDGQFFNPGQGCVSCEQAGFPAGSGDGCNCDKTNTGGAATCATCPGPSKCLRTDGVCIDVPQGQQRNPTTCQCENVTSGGGGTGGSTCTNSSGAQQPTTSLLTAGAGGKCVCPDTHDLITAAMGNDGCVAKTTGGGGGDGGTTDACPGQPGQCKGPQGCWQFNPLATNIRGADGNCTCPTGYTVVMGANSQYECRLDNPTTNCGKDGQLPPQGGQCCEGFMPEPGTGKCIPIGTGGAGVCPAEAPGTYPACICKDTTTTWDSASNTCKPKTTGSGGTGTCPDGKKRCVDGWLGADGVNCYPCQNGQVNPDGCGPCEAAGGGGGGGSTGTCPDGRTKCPKGEFFNPPDGKCMPCSGAGFPAGSGDGCACSSVTACPPEAPGNFPDCKCPDGKPFDTQTGKCGGSAPLPEGPGGTPVPGGAQFPHWAYGINGVSGEEMRSMAEAQYKPIYGDMWETILMDKYKDWANVPLTAKAPNPWDETPDMTRPDGKHWTKISALPTRPSTAATVGAEAGKECPQTPIGAKTIAGVKYNVLKYKYNPQTGECEEYHHLSSGSDSGTANCPNCSAATQCVDAAGKCVNIPDGQGKNQQTCACQPKTTASSCPDAGKCIDESTGQCRVMNGSTEKKDPSTGKCVSTIVQPITAPGPTTQPLTTQPLFGNTEASLAEGGNATSEKAAPKAAIQPLAEGGNATSDVAAPEPLFGATPGITADTTEAGITAPPDTSLTNDPYAADAPEQVQDGNEQQLFQYGQQPPPDQQQQPQGGNMFALDPNLFGPKTQQQPEQKKCPDGYFDFYGTCVKMG